MTGTLPLPANNPGLLLSDPDESVWIAGARAFCSDFISAAPERRYVLGRNVYARALAAHYLLAAFVDDYTTDTELLGRPIIRLNAVPADALVLIAAGGQVLSAARRLADCALRHLDYFAFQRWSGAVLPEMVFNEGFSAEFTAHTACYAKLAERLADDESRRTLRQLLSFRLSHNVRFLGGFTQREDIQYFEDFLNLAPNDECFVDVGGFDAQTSLEFIRRCPGYRAVHIFEPDAVNRQRCAERLAGHARVTLHACGLSDTSGELRFMSSGSGSRIVADGQLAIRVERLDELVGTRIEAPTFIKVDIEGAEAAALAGMHATIASHHPRLALSVYHRPGDYWRLAEAVLAVRDDYALYLRHYTESIYETVLFFIPR